MTFKCNLIVFTICLHITNLILTFLCFILEIEDAKKASESATSLQSPPPANAGNTPDYAAGLTATPSYAPATPASVTEPAATTPVAPAIPSPQQPATPAQASGASPTTVTTQPVQQQQQQSAISPIQQQVQVTSASTSPAPISIAQPVQQTTTHFIQTMRPVPPLLATTATGQRTLITTDQPQQVRSLPYISNVVQVQCNFI